MGTTSNFIKLRADKDPKVGAWNKAYSAALKLAKKEGKFIVTAWTNGDHCGYCIEAEKCMMTSTFKTWMKKKDVYFVLQYSGDKDKGKTLENWIYNGTGLKNFPGFRITLYNEKGNIIVDKAVEGNTLRSNKTSTAGANAMIAYLDKIFAKKPAPVKPEPAPEPPAPQKPYVVRLNEALTTAQVNKILDALDKNEGYCPCQVKSNGTKCHCEDFVKNKDYGVPCICKIYVKQKPVTSK